MLITKNIKSLLSYLKAMNKTLLSGSAWTIGAKTINGVSDYKILYITCKYSYGYAYILDNELIYEGVTKYNSNFVTSYITGILNGDIITIGNNGYVAHITSGNHGALGTEEIQSIRGIIPDPSKFGLGGVLKSTVFNACSRFAHLGNEVAPC